MHRSPVTYIHTAEAKHYKTIVDWGWYKCTEIDTGNICIDWTIRIRDTKMVMNGFTSNTILFIRKYLVAQNVIGSLSNP